MDVTSLVVGLVLAGAAGAAGAVLGRRSRARRERDDPEDLRERLYELAGEMEKFYSVAARPTDLRGHPRFAEAVEWLAASPLENDELVGYAGGDHEVVAILALEALAHRRAEEAVDPLLAQLESMKPRVACYLLETLDRLSDGPLVARVVLALGSEMHKGQFPAALAGFLRRRLASGEEVRFEGARALDIVHRFAIEHILSSAGEPGRKVLSAFRAWGTGSTGLEALATFGRVRRSGEAPHGILEEPYQQRLATQLVERFDSGVRRSVVVVGEEGVGKRTLVELVAARLSERGWSVVEASAVDLMAGQSFVGQLEERVKHLCKTLGKDKRALWVVPDFHDLAWAGRHHYAPTSVLDWLLPDLEKDRVVVLGTSTPAAYERLLARRPAVRAAVEMLRMEPLAEDAALDLVRRWSKRHAAQGSASLIDEETLREAAQLAQQHLGEQALPGRLLSFLDQVRNEVAEPGGRCTRSLGLDDLLAVLSRRTGLPVTILDDREGLDVESLRRFFRARIIGQHEAVECLVERVAMVKAGLCDPRRPLGVFLLCGPTGTGKTELAKTLAEFLFGTVDRMIRLDMSELQTPEAIGRLLGEPSEDAGGNALVDQIRKQPFSVVLLDEFEKAHPRIWDLFLQVFDDGRLTDQRGRVADFRHAFLLVTTNVGARSFFGANLGFGRGLDDRAVHRELGKVFRPELLNRFDRIVVFRPLSRAELRKILEKQLDAVLERRGLRHRPWAVEWDESAIDFLLRKGVSEELGARPLRRAIERYLLTPLAMSIVTNRAPSGDQFLFVRSDGEAIQVEFVDPDAEPAAPPATPVPEHLRVENLVVQARGSPEEIALLEKLHARIAARVDEAKLRERKQEELARIGEPDFWKRPDRFDVLARIEFVERVDDELAAAERLLQRLRRGAPFDLVQDLAGRLRLLDLAVQVELRGELQDAWLRVEPVADLRREADAALDFATRLVAMYRAWARRNRVEILESGGDGSASTTLGMSGFAASALLAPEHGMHVFEEPSPGGGLVRRRARVIVAPWPNGPRFETEQQAVAAAEQALALARKGGTRIVRCYREKPSPLVRDNVRAWRSGRLDRVLDGFFDVLG